VLNRSTVMFIAAFDAMKSQTRSPEHTMMNDGLLGVFRTARFKIAIDPEHIAPATLRLIAMDRSDYESLKQIHGYRPRVKIMVSRVQNSQKRLLSMT
jgi:hypothetical protein